MIKIVVQEFQWVRGKEDDPEDQCAHGRVLFQVNDTIFVKPDDNWTVTTSALYLLRTITEDHTTENPVSETNFLFPCCGFSVWPAGERFEVLCMGCSNGVDVEITHHQGMVTIKSSAGSEEVSESEWAAAVQGFVDSVQGFYKTSTPKAHIKDEYDRQGWAAFWKEWEERYQQALLMYGSSLLGWLSCNWF